MKKFIFKKYKATFIMMFIVLIPTIMLFNISYRLEMNEITKVNFTYSDQNSKRIVKDLEKYQIIDDDNSKKEVEINIINNKINFNILYKSEKDMTYNFLNIYANALNSNGIEYMEDYIIEQKTLGNNVLTTMINFSIIPYLMYIITMVVLFTRADINMKKYPLLLIRMSNSYNLKKLIRLEYFLMMSTLIFPSLALSLITYFIGNLEISDVLTVFALFTTANILFSLVIKNTMRLIPEGAIEFSIIIFTFFLPALAGMIVPVYLLEDNIKRFSLLDPFYYIVDIIHRVAYENAVLSIFVNSGLVLTLYILITYLYGKYKKTYQNISSNVFIE